MVRSVRFGYGASLVSLVVLLAACAPVGGEGPTGVAELDEVVEAALSGDVSLQREMISYSSLPCLTIEGLGGPPPCREGESEGTLVDVLPVIGAEGGHLRREEMQSWPGLIETELVAAYRLSDQVFADANYPAGEFGLLFSGEMAAEAITVHVRDGGIVRIDHHMGASLEEIVQREAGEMILEPTSS
jgi:hypothetical protein